MIKKHLFTNIALNIMIFVSGFLVYEGYQAANSTQMILAGIGFVLFLVLKIMFLKKINAMGGPDKTG